MEKKGERGVGKKGEEGEGGMGIEYSAAIKLHVQYLYFGND